MKRTLTISALVALALAVFAMSTLPAEAGRARCGRVFGSFPVIKGGVLAYIKTHSHSHAQPTPGSSPNPSPNPSPSPTPNPRPNPSPSPTPNPSPNPGPSPSPTPIPDPQYLPHGLAFTDFQVVPCLARMMVLWQTPCCRASSMKDSPERYNPNPGQSRTRPSWMFMAQPAWIRD